MGVARSVVVARAEEIGPGERKIVEIGGRSIGVFNIAGSYYALRNRCPHQGGPLCAGFLLRSLHSKQPGQYEHSGEAEIIRCPWHGWEFNVKTGRSWFDPERTRVRSYPAEIVEGPVGDAETYPAEVVEAPVGDAETYPAYREGSYVVVELER
jgi:nitrite reductase/ring-hydroxylating ferredoxin subunit